MSKCARCSKEVEPDEIHLFRGDETRRRDVEDRFQVPVSLCDKPIKLLPQPYICQGCKRFLFEFEEDTCPICKEEK